MSYTGNPSTAPADAVRLNVGDTDNSDLMLQDGEVAYFLDQRSGLVGYASADAARAIAAKFSRLVDKAVGDLKTSYSQRYDHFMSLAARLETDALTATTAVLGYAGGISVSDKRTQEQDSDRVKPAFRRDQFDNPRTGRQNLGPRPSGWSDDP